MASRFWRISNYADLSGEGGRRAGGRWHSPGRLVVYLADHPASAMLEALVRLGDITADLLPREFQLLTVEVDGRVETTVVKVESLVGDWRRDILMTRDIGDAWLSAGKTALLAVPNAIVPGVTNTLFNPLHRQANALRLADVARYPFDARLFARAAPKGAGQIRP